MDQRQKLGGDGAPLQHDRWQWGLLLVLLVALIIRLQSVNFGLPALNDPDELMFELGAVRMLRGPTLDPGWFGHPATTTMYVLALVDIGVFATGYLAGWFVSVRQFGDVIYGNPTWVILPGRIAITLFAIGTIVLTYRLASRLFDRRVGMIAAIILAASPIHITYSQIIRSDMMACFFLLLALLAALDIAEKGRWRNYVWASLWVGLAVATKWPFALSILAVIGAATWRASHEPHERRKILFHLAGCAALSVSFLLLASPYLAIDYPTVLRNLSGEGQARHLGATGGTPLHNLFWYVRSLAMDGIGPAGCLFAIGGLMALWRARVAAVILLPVAAGFLIVLSVQSLVWERWGLPLVPIAALLAGLGAIRLLDWFVQRQGRQLAPALTGMVILLTLAPLLWRAAGDARERMNDTRQIAAQWARTHIRPGQSVMVEHFAFDITNQPWHFLFPLGDIGCIDALALLHGKVSYQPIDAARGARSNIDYGTMAPARRSTCRVDYAILTQYERYKAERNHFPAEYAAYKELIGRGQVVAHFVPVAGRSGGPAVTIVRFASVP